jgi:hypothetical protein
VDRIIVGAHVRCYINARPFGRVQRAVIKISNPQNAVQGIDTTETVSLEDGQVVVAGTLTIYRMHLDGGIEAAGLVPPPRDLARGKYFSLLIVDRGPDSPLFQVDRAKVTDQEWRIDQGHMIGTVSFRGVTWQNETPDSTA